MGATDATAKLDDHRYSLQDLGISSSTDVYGDDRLTITLPPNPFFGTGEAQAVFNPSTRRWNLGITGRTKFSQVIDQTFKRKASIIDDTEFPSRSVKWTELLPKTDHVERFLHNIDWEATSLGPLDNWPTTLQAYLNIVFADNEAAVIYWGEDLVALYNDEFLRLVTGRLEKAHDLLGVPFIKIWPELWADFEPMLTMVASRGVGLETLEVNLFPLTDGFPEETFWQGSFLPIRDDSGHVRGFYNRAREITKSKINERRSKVLSAIAAKPNLTGNFIYHHLINCLSLSERDFPLAFVYSAHEDVIRGTCALRLQCAEGLPENGHPLVPNELELFEGSTGFLPFFRKAKSRDKALILRESDGTLPSHLNSGFAWNGFGEVSRSMAILPLSTSDRLIAMLVVGLNPRRPFDDETEGYLNTMLRSMSATVSSAIDREEARNRANRLAKQLEDSEKLIRETAEYGPVGMARYTPSGKLLWANDQYFEITGQSRDPEDHYEMSFFDFILEEDHPKCENLWMSMVNEKKSTSNPFRLKKTWRPPAPPGSDDEDMEQNIWVLGSGYPVMEGDEPKFYAISVTDISRFKWAEQVQAQTAKAAKEAKRLQENFIDIVSHEMRNPLSAITQLSDAISGSREDFEKTRKREQDARELLDTNVENAQTILLCSNHMKRIIDDVLTLSKLDSMLLSITPVVVQPCKIIEDVLKMFEAEFIASDIQVISEKSNSYTDLDVNWVTLDPSRLTQIFINLITNAVKFTKLEAERRITIRFSAANARPPSLAGVRWFPTNKKYKDLTLGAEWGNGKPIYICFEVQDTGRGLEQNEMNKLFGRFQQATEKTHLKYGGSGLGLFISRELTETQGGEIGVKSARGRGTTFAFYVKGRRSDPPDDAAHPLQSVQSPKTSKGQLKEAEEQRKIDTAGVNNSRDHVTILLCEDNFVNSKVLKTQLEKSNCEVHVANHGMEALDYLGRSRAWSGMSKEERALDFDVILMDVEMPIMDGLTCTRRIRQLQEEGKLTKHINVIAITGNARQEQIDTVLQVGADDVLPKPFRVKECVEKIKQLLAGRSTTKAVKRKDPA